MDSRPISIVILDDHTLLREGTRQLLTAFPYLTVIGEAANGEEALLVVDQLRPDVALVDIQLPGMNGLEVTRQIVANFPGTRVLILTAHADEDYLQAALNSGAAGYLLKTTPAYELAEAIRAVRSGTTVIDTSIVVRFVNQVKVQASVRTTDLTAREQEIMRLVGHGLSNKAIAAHLGISHRTVEGHLHRIFEKENVSSRTELLRYALEHNLLSIQPAD